MPELPEVEAARRAIEEHCLGRRIKKSIVADDPKVIDGVSPSDFEAAIIGKTIVASHRKGKNMWLQLDSPPFPSFQFGMAGAVYIKGVAVTKYKRSAVKDSDEWPSKYSKFFVELDDGLQFSFTDKRRFAKVRLLDNPVLVPPISELGPDALLEPLTVDEFWNSLKKKKIGIKALLLNQSFVSGIGNWMADEVLYQAKIHPQQSASSMSKEYCSTLLNCINEVTNSAVEVDADSLRFPVEWLFHFRWGKKPGNINGKKIEFITAGGRTTAYVPELQKLTGNQAVKEAGQPSEDDKDGNVDGSGKEEQSGNSKILKGRKSNITKKPSEETQGPSVEEREKDKDDIGAVDDKSSTKISRARKPSKRKSGLSIHDSDNAAAADDDKLLKKTRGAKDHFPSSRFDKNTRERGQKQARRKKIPAKRKQKDSGDELSGSSESGDDEEVANMAIKEKRMASSKKMVASRQKRQQKDKSD